MQTSCVHFAQDANAALGGTHRESTGSMKIALIAVIAFLLGACRVEEKTVETSTGQTSTTVTTVDTAEAVKKTETALEHAAEVTESAAREAAHKTGTAVEKAGKKIQEHAKPGKQ